MLRMVASSNINEFIERAKASGATEDNPYIYFPSD